MAAPGEQRSHEQGHGAFAQGIGGDDAFEVGNDPMMATEGEQRLGPFFHGHDAQLVQPLRLGEQPPFVAELAEGRAAPQVQGPVVQLDSTARLGNAGLGQELFEQLGIEGRPVQIESVALCGGDDRRVAEHGPQSRDVCQHRSSCAHRRKTIRPQAIDQPFGGHDLAGVGQHHGQ